MTTLIGIQPAVRSEIPVYCTYTVLSTIFQNFLSKMTKLALNRHQKTDCEYETELVVRRTSLTTIQTRLTLGTGLLAEHC